SQNQRFHGAARRVKERRILRVAAQLQWTEKTPGRCYFLSSSDLLLRFYGYHFYNIKGVFM
ncbi:hypothetical protein, partial [Escherichia albertii]|uniref:hypothetical protein n=1 Tax=Escherichia albertii TaxID=208962 RepID=UPI001F408EB4